MRWSSFIRKREKSELPDLRISWLLIVAPNHAIDNLINLRIYEECASVFEIWRSAHQLGRFRPQQPSPTTNASFCTDPNHESNPSTSNAKDLGMFFCKSRSTWFRNTSILRISSVSPSIHITCPMQRLIRWKPSPTKHEVELLSYATKCLGGNWRNPSEIEASVEIQHEKRVSPKIIAN